MILQKIPDWVFYTQVFLKKDDTNTALTQIAWSCFEPGEYCDMHSHLTMDESLTPIVSMHDVYDLMSVCFTAEESMHNGEKIKIKYY
jgi:hypothetical protein